MASFLTSFFRPDPFNELNTLATQTTQFSSRINRIKQGDVAGLERIQTEIEKHQEIFQAKLAECTALNPARVAAPNASFTTNLERVTRAFATCISDKLIPTLGADVGALKSSRLRSDNWVDVRDNYNHCLRTKDKIVELKSFVETILPNETDSIGEQLDRVSDELADFTETFHKAGTALGLSCSMPKSKSSLRGELLKSAQQTGNSLKTFGLNVLNIATKATAAALTTAALVDSNVISWLNQSNSAIYDLSKINLSAVANELLPDIITDTLLPFAEEKLPSNPVSENPLYTAAALAFITRDYLAIPATKLAFKMGFRTLSTATRLTALVAGTLARGSARVALYCGKKALSSAGSVAQFVNRRDLETAAGIGALGTIASLVPEASPATLPALATSATLFAAAGAKRLCRVALEKVWGNGI